MTQVGKRGIINKAVTFNGAAYYFLKNLQGDVIALTNADGEVIARYTYDAWGKVLSVTDANGIRLIISGVASIVSAISKGFVASALGSATAKYIGVLLGIILGMLPLGQYWAVIVNIAIILSLLMKFKSMFYNIRKGYEQLKKAVS